MRYLGSHALDGSELSPEGQPNRTPEPGDQKGIRIQLPENHRLWDTKIPKILFTIRNRRNLATGYAPSELLLGRLLKRPGEWSLPHNQPEVPINPEDQEETRERCQAARGNQERYQQQRRPPDVVPPPFQVGERVLIKNHVLSNKALGYHAGFAPKWRGPCVITKQRGTVYWVQEDDGSETKVHADAIQPLPTRPELLQDPGEEDSDNDNET